MQISVIWMELEDVMINEVSQKKDKNMMTSYRWPHIEEQDEDMKEGCLDQLEPRV